MNNDLSSIYIISRYYHGYIYFIMHGYYLNENKVVLDF